MHCTRVSIELKELSHFLLEHYHQSIVFGNNCYLSAHKHFQKERVRTSLTFTISLFIHKKGDWVTTSRKNICAKDINLYLFTPFVS